MKTSTPAARDRANRALGIVTGTVAASAVVAVGAATVAAAQQTQQTQAAKAAHAAAVQGAVSAPVELRDRESRTVTDRVLTQAQPGAGGAAPAAPAAPKAPSAGGLSTRSGTCMPGTSLCKNSAFFTEARGKMPTKNGRLGNVSVSSKKRSGA